MKEEKLELKQREKLVNFETVASWLLGIGAIVLATEAIVQYFGGGVSTVVESIRQMMPGKKLN